MSRRDNETRPARIRALLREIGPMTRAEIGRLMPGIPDRNLSGAISNMRKAANPRTRVRISSWTRDGGGDRSFLRPVYALGRKADAPRPEPISNAEQCRRHRKSRSLASVYANTVPVSVFDLARLAA